MNQAGGILAKRTRKHKKKHRFLYILIPLALVGCGILVWHLPYFQVSQIAVIGNKTVSDEEIIALSEIKSGSSIFGVHPMLAQRKIKENLYIGSVNVDRHLPSHIEIIVKERQAAAQFVKEEKKKKSYVIIDQNGLVLGVAGKKQKVTLIDKVTVTAAEEGEMLQVKENGIYEKSMKLIQTAGSGDLYFKRISISGSRVEAYIFDKLVCKGRYNNIVKSIESGELKSVVYRMYQRDIDKGTINIGDNNYCSFTPQK